MKKCRYFLGSMLIFLWLFGSCSGGTDPGGSRPLEEEGIEEKLKDPGKDDDDDEMKEEDTGDNEGTPEIPPLATFLHYKTLSDNDIVFEFSDPVLFVSLNFVPKMGYEVIEEEGSKIIIKLTGNSDPGLSVVADLQVIDKYENHINEQITFRTRNNHVPKLQINELRTEYSSSNNVQKAEFIEFKMISDGNLGALRVFAVGNDKTPQIYEFEPVVVNAGEYVVLHLRTLEASCKDEYGISLSESGGTDSCITARDIWVPGKEKLLHKTDVVYVLDQDDEVLDAIMIVEKPDLLWGKSFIDAADFLFRKGVWKSPAGTVCSPADAVNSSNTTTTRTICRDETVANTHTRADWYITKTSKATPGKENSPDRL